MCYVRIHRQFIKIALKKHEFENFLLTLDHFQENHDLFLKNYEKL